MSYDKTWIQSRKHPREMQERGEARKKNLLRQFEDEVNHLNALGHVVTLSAGKNFIFDELFLFRTQLDAQEFFDLDYLEWERFPCDDEGEGFGFDNVSLFKGGCQVASKSCAPSKWVDSADEWDDDFALDILTGELEIINPKWRCSGSSKFPTDSESSKDFDEIDE